jgi:uncharacterized SAM-binding protein YcdF (DUF218 family)
MRRSLRRGLMWAVPALLAWIGGAFGLDWYGRAHTAGGHFDAIVVAGAKVWRGGRPSKALTRRTDAGVELWKAGHAPLLVLTGGLGQHAPAEARVAAQLAREHGVPETALRIEERSKNTIENAAHARTLIGPIRVLVVTDAYHVLRCELIYRHYFPEVQVVGIPLGRRPPLTDALIEVAAIAALPISAARYWLFG